MQIFAELTEHFNQLGGSRFHAFTHSLSATHFAGCFHFAEGGHISSIIVNGGSLQGNLFGGDLPEQMLAWAGGSPGPGPVMSKSKGARLISDRVVCGVHNFRKLLHENLSCFPPCQ